MCVYEFADNGPGRYCPPRHMMPFHSRNEQSNLVNQMVAGGSRQYCISLPAAACGRAEPRTACEPEGWDSSGTRRTRETPACSCPPACSPASPRSRVIENKHSKIGAMLTFMFMMNAHQVVRKMRRRFNIGQGLDLNNPLIQTRGRGGGSSTSVERLSSIPPRSYRRADEAEEIRRRSSACSQ